MTHHHDPGSHWAEPRMLHATAAMIQANWPQYGNLATRLQELNTRIQTETCEHLWQMRQMGQSL